jgi:diacylglycerol kinase (ATP)
VPAPSRVLVIINPVSGPRRRGNAAYRGRLASRALEALGVQADIRFTERVGHAHDLARAGVESGADLVFAWGGDGTINEIGRAVASTPAALGIIPGGSGNGLARQLGIPFSPRRAIARAIGSSGRLIDAGELGGRMFFNVAGIGLDAHVAAIVATWMNHRGLLPYLTASARDFLRYRSTHYAIQADGLDLRMKALTVAFANSGQYGFGARVAPAAVIDDGLLDLVAIEDRGLVGNVMRVPSMFLGSLNRQRGVTSRQTTTITVGSEAPMLFHVDGEPMNGGRELTARVHPSVLRVRA